MENKLRPLVHQLLLLLKCDSYRCARVLPLEYAWILPEFISLSNQCRTVHHQTSEVLRTEDLIFRIEDVDIPRGISENR